MYSVLFVCTGNQYRSPIAAEVFRMQLAEDGRSAHCKVDSAGTWAFSGQHVPLDAAELARSFGVDINNHQTRLLDAKMLKDSDVVLVMEEGHKEAIQSEFPFARNKVHLLSQVVEGVAYDVPDPAGAGEESRIIIRDLVAMIRAGYGRIYSISKTG
jgi:protein-tyrosine phosphatase